MEPFRANFTSQDCRRPAVSHPALSSLSEPSIRAAASRTLSSESDRLGSSRSDNITGGYLRDFINLVKQTSDDGVLTVIARSEAIQSVYEGVIGGINEQIRGDINPQELENLTRFSAKLVQQASPSQVVATLGSIDDLSPYISTLCTERTRSESSSFIKRQLQEASGTAMVELLLTTNDEQKIKGYVKDISCGHGWFLSSEALIETLTHTLSERVLSPAQQVLIYKLILKILKNTKVKVQIPGLREIVREDLKSRSEEVVVAACELYPILSKGSSLRMSASSSGSFLNLDTENDYPTLLEKKLNEKKLIRAASLTPRQPASCETIFEMLLKHEEGSGSPLETLAADLFLCSSRYFRQIPLTEFYNYDPGKPELFPAIAEATSYFNNLEKFVTQKLESVKNEKDRLCLTKRFIRLLDRCKRKNDLYSTYAIFSALARNENTLLKKAFEEIQVKDRNQSDKNIYANMKDLFNLAGNMITLRNEWSKFDEPSKESFVPPLNVITKDLTSLREMSPFVMEAFNIDKLANCALAAWRIILAQRIPLPDSPPQTDIALCLITK